MSKWCRHVQVRPYHFIFTEACLCRLELAYFMAKISKNRLVCKNAVAFAYHGSCSLLVMGSYFLQGWTWSECTFSLTLAQSYTHLWFLFGFVHHSVLCYGGPLNCSPATSLCSVIKILGCWRRIASSRAAISSVFISLNITFILNVSPETITYLVITYTRIDKAD